MSIRSNEGLLSYYVACLSIVSTKMEQDYQIPKVTTFFKSKLLSNYVACLSIVSTKMEQDYQIPKVTTSFKSKLSEMLISLIFSPGENSKYVSQFYL